MKKEPLKLEAGHSGKLLPDVWQKWQEVTSAYSDRHGNDDAFWWYRERTWIGFLAAAVWRLGGVALEEYACKKSGGKLGKGRVDLYFNLEHEGFIAEAKHVWMGRTQRKDGLVEFCKKGLQRSEKDVLNVPGSERLLAVLFISPTVAADDSTKNDSLSALIENLKKSRSDINFHAMAWVFPDWARCPSWLNKTKIKGNYSPGGILLVREVKRPSRRKGTKLRTRP